MLRKQWFPILKLPIIGKLQNLNKNNNSILMEWVTRLVSNYWNRICRCRQAPRTAHWLLQRHRELPPLPSDGDIQSKRFQLEMEMTNSQKAALNNGTTSNYLNYLSSYTKLCNEYGYKPFPLDEITLSMFAQYLSRKLKPQSIKCAVSSLRTISNTVGYKTMESQFPKVKLMLRGISNLKPAPPKRAHQMTAHILMNICENLDLSDKFQARMWALFTTCFFFLFRKSNVTPDKDLESNYMCRKHIHQTINGNLITLYWTKTIQSGESCLEFPLLEAPGSPLCPAWAIKNMIKLVPTSDEKPAFCYSLGQPISYSTFKQIPQSSNKEAWNVRWLLVNTFIQMRRCNIFSSLWCPRKTN